MAPDSGIAPNAQQAPARTGPASRWFRVNLWLHRWTSLIATIPFLILCLTGTVLIFHEEIDHAMGVVPELSQAAPPRPMADSVAAVQAKFPDQRILSVAMEEDHPGVVMVATAPPGDRGYDRSVFHFADQSTAQLVGGVDLEKTLTGFLLTLHANWFLGPVGELIGALIALLVLISLLSGLVVYAPYVKRIAFGVLRRGRGARLLQLDLHNFIGAVVLGWALVVTVTGLMLGFGTLAAGIWQGTELPRLQARFGGAMADPRKPVATVDQAWQAAARAVPDGKVLSVIWPDTDYSTQRHYTVFLSGKEGLKERMYQIALVDGETGQVATVKQPPWYLQAIWLSQPFHFGDYGGLALKLLWTLCTWLTLFITANGAWLWWDRRRRRNGNGKREGAIA
ncbi:PepSY-associated TM helix domain-containing protein [Vulcaniibacterium tengchongense]|uniref:Putative iron-regulated membrane protein n=1 Tax=Vulcaniibacterium tengchongense TaxID=1273429 RepID=A0A3N4VA01_9GAMM|nr:PepSY-associated TM helix domain-containing protein [Vulcaniibacterium tengchongense]RPE79812.1 putative iron-regulated membrane protein [Vulcaniibacterium tengchongense]